MTPCVEHKGQIDTHGYGQIVISGRVKQAHRVAWERANGLIPDGLCVLHDCDNRPCVNVDHLFLGTKADNTADMFRKGRQHCRKGVMNPMAKLREDDIPVIRSMLAKRLRQADIATHFGVSFQTISLIKLGRIWIHV